MSGLGLKFQTMGRGMSCPFHPVRLYGPAYTVACYPGATWAVEQALEEAPEGSVLVINGEGFSGAVLMGGLMSLRAARRGLAGAVIDGAIRDLPEIRERRWPMFATAVSPRGGTHDQIGGAGQPVSCAGVVVHPGDHVIGDDDGVVVVPAARWEEVLQQTRLIEKKEAFLTERLMANQSLGQAVAEWKQHAG